MNMSNDVHHSVVLQALGWKTLEAERKKAKATRNPRIVQSFRSQTNV